MSRIFLFIPIARAQALDAGIYRLALCRLSYPRPTRHPMLFLLLLLPLLRSYMCAFIKIKILSSTLSSVGVNVDLIDWNKVESFLHFTILLSRWVDSCADPVCAGKGLVGHRHCTTVNPLILSVQLIAQTSVYLFSDSSSLPV